MRITTQKRDQALGNITVFSGILHCLTEEAQLIIGYPVGERTAREWSRAEPRVLVYGWVARKTVQFTVIWYIAYSLGG